MWHCGTSSCTFGIVSYAPWRISKGNGGMHVSGPWLNFLVVSDCQKNDWWFNPSEKYGNHQYFLGIIPFLCLNQLNQQANLISQLSQGQWITGNHTSVPTELKVIYQRIGLREHLLSGKVGFLSRNVVPRSVWGYCIVESFPNTILNQCNCLGGTVLGQFFSAFFQLFSSWFHSFQHLFSMFQLFFRIFFGMFEINQLID